MAHLDLVSYLSQYLGVIFGFFLLFLIVVFVVLPLQQRQLILRGASLDMDNHYGFVGGEGRKVFVSAH